MSEFPILFAEEELLIGLGLELITVDVSDPSRLRVGERHRLKMTMEAEGLARRGQFVLVGAAEDGVLVFQMTRFPWAARFSRRVGRQCYRAGVAASGPITCGHVRGHLDECSPMGLHSCA